MDGCGWDGGVAVTIDVVFVLVVGEDGFYFCDEVLEMLVLVIGLVGLCCGLGGRCFGLGGLCCGVWVIWVIWVLFVFFVVKVHVLVVCVHGLI